ncbi:MAG: hypothetical protein PHO37_10150 [Kiritimatiellae bacterium]|nr:hypothetical protein [Kiritimatiellia bacterium]
MRLPPSASFALCAKLHMRCTAEYIRRYAVDDCKTNRSQRRFPIGHVRLETKMRSKEVVRYAGDCGQHANNQGMHSGQPHSD